MNAEAEKLLARPGADLEGKAIQNLLPALNLDLHPGIDSFAGLVPAPAHLLLDASRVDGTKVRVQVSLTPVGADPDSFFMARLKAVAGKDEGGPGVARIPPVSPDRFLSLLSHELRNPLQAMMGWVQLVRARAGEDRWLAQGLDAIERNIRMQSRVIEELLEMSELGSGAPVLEKRSLLLSAILESSMEEFSTDAASRGVRLSRGGRWEEEEVLVDSAKVQRVIQILLSHALRFTPSGGSIQIDLRKAGAFVELSVTDSNSGGVEAESVYDEFRHGAPSTTNELGHLSIGLGNAQKLVEMNAGTMRAESAGFGRGVKFVVSFPRCR